MQDVRNSERATHAADLQFVAPLVARRALAKVAKGDFPTPISAKSRSQAAGAAPKLARMALSNRPPRRSPSQGDAANKRLFSHPRMVADLLRLVGKPWVDDLDLDRLARLPAEHVADSRRARRQDMPWLAPFKPGIGYPPGACALAQLEFQSRPHPHMAERMLEYAALLRGDLLRGGALAAVSAHVPLVVYNGRAPWSPRLRVEEGTAWVPAALARLQPRFEFRFVDAKTYRGDRVLDGNAARAWLALDAADVAGLAAALEYAARNFARVDAGLRRAFEVWCGGVLRQRFGDRLRSLTEMMETPTMLAETLQEWEEQKLSEGRQAGREEGRQAGREEERARLRMLAKRHFDAATANTLARIIAEDTGPESR